MKYLLIALIAFATQTSFAQTKDVRSIIDEGVQLHDKGDYNGALKKYEEALRIDPKNESAIYESCITYMLLKDYNKSIELADKLIAAKSSLSDDAYVTKGSALEILNRYEDAVLTYNKGIEEYPKSYLLRYNLALTYFKKQDFENTELAIYKSLALNPMHASSNLILGYALFYEEKRAQSLLALFYFLTLEPNSDRSQTACQVVNQLKDKGVTRKDDKTINITLSKDQDNSFSTLETFLSLSSAVKYTEAEAKKTEQEKFIAYVESMFKFIAESKDKKYSGCWANYVSFFTDLQKSGHTPAFCYHILQSDNSFGSEKWIAANSSKYQAFIKWLAGKESAMQGKHANPIQLEEK